MYFFLLAMFSYFVEDSDLGSAMSSQAGTQHEGGTGASESVQVGDV
jgi:hypothetical protein